VSEVRHIVPAEVESAAALLSRAFFDDPLTVWMFPAPETRAEFNNSFETTTVAAVVQGGHAYQMADGSGAAIWTPPGVDVLDDSAVANIAEIIRSANPERADEVLGGLLQMHTNHPETPHFALMEIGVVPEARGRGLGSRLLRDRLDRCDHYGHPAYLDATSSQNVALYRRHGFEVIHETQLPDGPNISGMWRKPGCG